MTFDLGELRSHRSRWMDATGKWYDFYEVLGALVSRIMGCFGCCFGLSRKSTKAPKQASYYPAGASQEQLLKFPGSDTASSGKRSSSARFSSSGRELVGVRLGKSSQENGWSVENAADPVIDVKITRRANTSQSYDGSKMINQYVRHERIGKGSYGKVVLHRSLFDQKFYAIKVFDKSRLGKIRVAPSETAMMDVRREVEVMKHLRHPNIVRLIEVIDDPECDQLYMVLEYIEGQRMFKQSGPPGGLGESTARRYFRDIVAGLMYLHNNKVIHGDIKPENLMITAEGRIKIGDFGISRTFEGDDDLLRRSPGTPVFTAPECCKGMAYHGKAADVWALGVTLYCMVTGQYPFVGENFQDTYDKIVQQELSVPPGLDPDLQNLLEGLLCKDPDQRMTLDAASCHPWLLKASS
ncbi:serine/threonine-protein kinase GRIK1 isoform X2 [Selaginella moellendorffii]|uniref:serine/threonine-protein kinase GRIK1 isoform X2 n=1 Tax=Selaginella moellendorffii TaxID=88036 RepID=UPI000D1CEE36|nr:serine/threonine-protein kinase GRIK1 isoform X2 [Selaginella moellendorffii]|eukprot:XP_024544736.1 serine/threonine-protein kinase GRIK1 isoform X2 [Selaginella moellendorffii]